MATIGTSYEGDGTASPVQGLTMSTTEAVSIENGRRPERVRKLPERYRESLNPNEAIAQTSRKPAGSKRNVSQVTQPELQRASRKKAKKLGSQQVSHGTPAPSKKGRKRQIDNIQEEATEPAQVGALLVWPFEHALGLTNTHHPYHSSVCSVKTGCFC